MGGSSTFEPREAHCDHIVRRAPVPATRHTNLRDDGHDGGVHLGVVAAGPNQTSFKWRASPWGTWDVQKSPITLDGINCTFHSISNADGRFGANDSAINYAGSYAMVEGTNIAYGFFGEFWKGSEANQFLHFHDSGLFVGQFGTISQFGSMGLGPKIPGDMGGEFEVFHYALPGEAGNSFAPSLVTASNKRVYFFHNDESKHDGVHRWQLTGADALVLRSAERRAAAVPAASSPAAHSSQ